jgi:hypothetical protein
MPSSAEARSSSEPALDPDDEKSGKLLIAVTLEIEKV